MSPKRTRSNQANTKVNKKSKSIADGELSSSDIANIEKKVISNSKSYNDIAQVVSYFASLRSQLSKSVSEQLELRGRECCISLFRIFRHLFRTGMLVSTSSTPEKKQLVIKWLLDKYLKYKEQLLFLIKEKLAFESSLQVDAIEVLLNLIPLEAEYFKPSKNDSYFPTNTYRDVIKSLLFSTIGHQDVEMTQNFVVLAFVEKFKKYWDLQAYFYNELPVIIDSLDENDRNIEIGVAFSNFYLILNSKLLFSEDPQELKERKTIVKTKLPSVAFKPSKFKSNFQKSLLELIKIPLDTQQVKDLLLILHKRAIPFMSKPESLMDFLTDAYDSNIDESVQILALNSLYELMKKYNLEYPDFYIKLYSLLTPSLMYSRYRSRFIRLCDLFLSSTHLSAVLVASFIKRLAQLALISSAPGVVITIPLIYNLMKRHPSCMILIHNTETDTSTYKDTFKKNEIDPLQTGAMGSSLWELETMMSHYHPNIATLARIYKEPFKKASYNLEDFLDWTYTSLLESEKTKRFRDNIAFEYEEWDNLLHTPSSDSGKSTYLEGWTL